MILCVRNIVHVIQFYRELKAALLLCGRLGLVLLICYIISVIRDAIMVILVHLFHFILLVHLLRPYPDIPQSKGKECSVLLKGCSETLY